MVAEMPRLVMQPQQPSVDFCVENNMANKRMFSKQIVQTDAFMDMPPTSQLLYFHLAMEADDDGFVASPKKIIRNVGSNDDDYKILVGKRFIIPFENGVCVIKHWLIHNCIRKDTYAPTNYIKQKKMLQIKENKAYTETPLTGRQRLVDGTLPKIREDKIREDKISIAEINSASPFSLKEEIQKLYDNKRRDLNVIALYFEEKKPDLRDYEQYSVALKRHLRPAGQLKVFTDDQILKAVDCAKKEYSEIWTIDTLIKILTK